MFLIYLNDANKENFLKLCVNAALSNGEFAEAQVKALEGYCTELKVSPHIPERSESLEKLLNEINQNCRNNVEKNIILIEIISFINADGLIDEPEKVFLTKIAQHLDINVEKLDIYISLIKKYSELTKAILTEIIK